MNDNYVKQHQLQKFDPIFGSKTLGVILVIGSNNHDTITGINKEYGSWSDKILIRHIHNNKAWLYLKFAIIIIISYTILYPNLTELGCNKILLYILQMGLNYIGIC